MKRFFFLITLLLLPSIVYGATATPTATAIFRNATTLQQLGSGPDDTLLYKGKQIVAGSGGGSVTTQNLTFAAGDNMVITGDDETQTVTFAVYSSPTFHDVISKGPMVDVRHPSFAGGAKVDGMTDDTNAIEAAGVYLESMGGGTIVFPGGTVLLSYLHLHKGVTYIGQGEVTVLKQKGGTNANFVTLSSNDSRACHILNMVIDGNKTGGNTSGAGVYLYQGVASSPITGDTDSRNEIRYVTIRNCAGKGLDIDGAGTVGADYWNVRALYLDHVYLRSNGDVGLRAHLMSDSVFNTVVSSGNAKSGFYLDAITNNHFISSKSFYNASGGVSGTDAGWYVTNSKRCTFVSPEAQEEYQDGFYVTGSSNLIFSNAVADANGRVGAEKTGFIFKNSSGIIFDGVATSFHTPTWQGTGLKIDNTSTSTFNLMADNQLTTSYSYLSGSSLHLKVNGETITKSNYITHVYRDDNTRTEIRNVDGGSGNDATFDTDPFTGNSSANAQVRYFRQTNTSGAVQSIFYKGDGSNTVQHMLSGNSDSYLAASAGGLSIGKSTITSGKKLDVNGASTFSATNTRTDVVNNDGGSGNDATFDVSPIPGTGSAAASVRYFRTTNTSGNSLVQVFKGNNTSTANAQIAGTGATYFAADNGRVMVGTSTDDGVNKLQVNGNVISTQYKLATLNTAPASATATGTLGEIRIDANYIYFCTATNTWKRAALATW